MNIVSELGEYTHNIKGNVMGGLTAGVVALPLCLAFGIASGLGAASGLYGAICLSFFAAIFGGTKTQISGPTGPMTVVTASVVVTLGGNIAMVASVFVMAGLFQILFGFFRLGKYIKYIPYAVISGFMSGVGLIIILLQLSPLLGGPAPKGPVDGLLILGRIDINLYSAILGVAALAIIYLVPKKIGALFPPPLLALIVLSAISYFCGFDVPVIGEIPSGLPTLYMPEISIEHAQTIVTYGFILAILGSIDSLLTSLVADSMTKTKHSSNRELIGQGIGNALCGIVAGNVGAGATMRTVTNIKVGGTGRLSGVMSSVFLTLVLLSLYNVVCYVPLSVLAGILVSVGVNIFDYRLLKEIKVCPRFDIVIMVTVFLITVFVDLIFAVGVGIVLAALALIYRVNHQTHFDVEMKGDIALCTIRGGFYFGSCSDLAQQFSALKAKTYIVDLTKIAFSDTSGIYAFEDEIGIKVASGSDVYLVTNKLHNFMKMADKLGPEYTFSSVEDALKAASK